MSDTKVNNIAERRKNAFNHNKRSLENCLKQLFNTKESDRNEALGSAALLLNNRRNMFRGTGEVNKEKLEDSPKIELGWKDADIRGNSENAESKIVALYNGIEKERAAYYGKNKVRDPSIGQPLQTVSAKRKAEFAKYMGAKAAQLSTGKTR